MPNILFISHMYPTSYDKNYGKVIHEQALSLLKKGHHVKVICPVPYTLPLFKYINKKYEKYSSLSEKEIHDGIEVYYPKYLRLPKQLLLEKEHFRVHRSVKKVIKNIYKDFQFDLIHAHFGFPDAATSYLLAEEWNVPLCITIQSTDLDKTINKSEKMRDIITHTLKSADQVIVPSPRLKEELKNEVDVDGCFIGYGIDLKLVRNDEKLRSDIDFSSTLNIVSICRLLPTKGIDYTIHALKKIMHINSNIKFFVIGDGEEKEKLLQLSAHLGLSKKIEFLGALDHAEAMKYLKKADIFLLPSWQETFGLVYAEAMANNVLTIGCQGQGFDGIIEDEVNGLLTIPKDVDSIAEKVLFVLNNPKNAKVIASKGKETVESMFTFEKIADQIDDIYHTL